MSYGQPYGSRDGQTRAYPMPGQAPQDRRDYRQPQGGSRQPPPYVPPGQQQGPAPRPPRRKRRVGRILLIILLAIVVLIAAIWIYLETSMTRVAALGDYEGRPAAAAGTNWLIVGSDSRAGLDSEDQERLSTGDAKGQRTDTMLLLHLPDNNEKPTMVSLLRDSYVDIPGKGKNKLNAAYAFGGPKLLAQTVEMNTGLRLDHYIEIGFGGFAGIVDSVGGVEMCLDKPIKDPLAGIDLPAGCQELDGANALGYVRTRATPRADLDRVVHQRQFIAALMDKTTSPGTLINPFRMIPLLADVPDAITLDEGDHLHNLPPLGFAMAGASTGETVSTTVPIGGQRSVPKIGSVILWDQAKSKQLFDALRNDTTLPSSLIVVPGS
ncbi:LCP family protein required for cell wall assembly [Kibdelosporangium banguiense]|uniref:LCP family protein required for cell wall assembly n=1 Tax=Kibdelosporangium banguiense TaxID=1365924 RepID=A0ABS4TMW8_9PSEU|nr:LCP family protein [Kibdelosporangium banguiense]MBP2325758.1 LCP family protein required for cell wall assembly [Kibdelosporangium banguiense]